MSETAQPPFVVAGLGASAGGLEALQTFLENTPEDAPIAYVIVMHRAPQGETILPLLLGRQTQLPVLEVEDGMRLQARHVYVAPSGRYVGIRQGALVLTDFDTSRALAMPINHFFRALAREYGEQAVGIVLSGTGTDGTAGMREIEATLGVGMVQEEGDARFGGMPHSAIHGDEPSVVAKVAELPGRLVSYVERMRERDAARPDASATPDVLQQVLSLLRQRTGHDFSAYKQTTMRRRVERRMLLRRLDTMAEYLQWMQGSATEASLLLDELLIGVTSFFRDASAFEGLSTQLLDYLASKPDGYMVRVWVAGCSTGEEAYSLAIVFTECLEQLRRDMRVQIFATDLDTKAIEYARAGAYPRSISDDLSRERLKRFFVQTEQGYQVRKDLRDLLVFAPQNLIDDPPFTKLDMLSCRNLLIYLDSNQHKRLFPIFHYVLKPGGLLFLGSSETVGAFAHLFESCDKKARLSRRKTVDAGTYLADLSTSVPLDHASGTSAQLAGRVARGESITLQVAERLLLRELVPPTVLMRERGEIVHIHGRTGLFLEPAQGLQTSANIFDMAREGLLLELSAAVRQAASQTHEVLRHGIEVQVDGASIVVDLRVKMLSEPESARGLFRVSFELGSYEHVEPGIASQPGHEQRRTNELERTLRDTKDNLQGTIEELQTANEEMRSTNEELQSANEEFETSREELQSLNEELQTVNLELQGKVEELSRANDDMTNLLNATDIAIIFLDDDLNIKRHNVQAKRIIRLIASDIGRSIGDLVSRLHYDRLIEDAREVLRTLLYKEVEVRGEGDERWYLMRILPYRTTDHVVDGLVVTFVDITRSKLLQQNELRMAHALQHAPVTVFGVDSQLVITWACGPVFGIEGPATLGKALGALYDDSYQPVWELLTRALEEGVPLRGQTKLTVRGRPGDYELYIEPDAALDARGATCVAVELPPSS